MAMLMMAPLSQAGVMPNISAFFEVGDLCSLDATSTEIQESMANGEGKPVAWLTAASHAGLSFGDVDKKSIKAVFGAVKNHHFKIQPPTIAVSTSRAAKELCQATQQMKNMRMQHLGSGGEIAEPFIARFSFTPECVKMYLANPHVTIYSIPVAMTVGKAVLQVSLAWHAEKTWLHTEAKCKGTFKPVIMQLRTVSSPLTIRKHFCVWGKSRQEQEGDGLCCMLPTEATLADILCKDGILCVGLVSDLAEVDGELPLGFNLRRTSPPMISCALDSHATNGLPGQRLNALHLDMPRRSMRKLLRS